MLNPLPYKFTASPRARALIGSVTRSGIEFSVVLQIGNALVFREKGLDSRERTEILRYHFLIRDLDLTVFFEVGDQTHQAQGIDDAGLNQICRFVKMSLTSSKKFLPDERLYRTYPLLGLFQRH